MSHSTTFTGHELPPLSSNDGSAGAILYTIGDRLHKKSDAGTLKNPVIHEDYLDDALKGRPYGAKVIDLAEYRWMRLFDEL